MGGGGGDVKQKTFCGVSMDICCTLNRPIREKVTIGNLLIV